MQKETFLALAAALGITGAIAGCNTVEGVGEDVQGAGEAVEDASQDSKDEIEEERDD